MTETRRAGLDWYSATRPEGPGAWEWMMRGVRAINSIAADGNQVQARSLNGYQGIAAGACFAGSREDGYFVQMSGHYADIYFSELYDSDVQCTRVDYQVTVQYDDMPTQLGEECYYASVRHTDNLPEAKRWKTYRFSGSDGGFSCYIGGVSSDHRACIYNKDKQANTPEFERCWRFEVRFRGERAAKWAAFAAYQSLPRADVVLEVVSSWLSARGVDIPALGRGELATVPRAAARRPDTAVKLKWLHSQVAPSVRWLLEREDRATILAALGLADATTQP